MRFKIAFSVAGIREIGLCASICVFSTSNGERRSPMEKRMLGFAGPEVPVICLGGNVYGWTLPETEAFRPLDAALDSGLNFVDTADV
jgi:hypothetical protein